MRCLALVILFLMNLTAPQTGFAKEKIVAVTSFTVIADIVQNVGGKFVDVYSITKPGADVHGYQPTPQDIVRAQKADVIFWNGMNLERWFERFLQDVRDVPHYVLSDGIEPLSIYEGEYAGKPNPHAWMSIENARIYIENVRAALSAVDPAHAKIYAQNAQSYAARLEGLKTRIQAVISAIPQEQRSLVTSEGAFSYLAKDLGFKEVYLWAMNSEHQGSPQQVRKVIDIMRKQNIPVIFSESTVSDKPARQVARETGALYGGVLYVDSLSAADGPVPSYYDLMQVTSETIAQGFVRALAQNKE